MVDTNEGISKPSPLEILRDWRFMAVSQCFPFFLVTEKKHFHDYAFCVAHPFVVTGILLLVSFLPMQQQQASPFKLIIKTF